MENKTSHRMNAHVIKLLRSKVMIISTRPKTNPSMNIPRISLY